MAVVRWDPFRDVVSLQSRLNSLFQDYGRGSTTGRSEFEGDALAAASFAPAVDIYEDEHKLVLKLEVPGVKQDDIDIQIEGRTLTVRGERRFQNEEKQENFHRVEHRYGTFARSFTLPGTVDPENVKATCDAGVLELELPKKAEAKPRQIKIGVGSANASSNPGAQKQVEGARPEASRTEQTRTEQTRTEQPSRTTSVRVFSGLRLTFEDVLGTAHGRVAEEGTHSEK
jgi:HSP20 family protein